MFNHDLMLILPAMEDTLAVMLTKMPAWLFAFCDPNEPFPFIRSGEKYFAIKSGPIELTSKVFLRPWRNYQILMYGKGSSEKFGYF